MALLICALLLALSSCLASEPAPVRLALVSEAPEAAPALDLLTVSLTKQSAVALLERAEVDRVYREQALAAGEGDYVKLGQVLGADGLLVLSPAKEGEAAELSLRLVAVRPGVIVSSVRSPWPVEDGAQWAEGMARRFAAWVPKLAVRAGEAVPLSLVNLHSALQSANGRETEQRLSVLAVERLSREPELFVLERQRMDLLSAEKELKGVEKSAFWDGSYVLEGVLDRDGYSPATITLNARLVPPKGGAPLDIELRGSRTNLAGVVEELAQKVIAALKLRPSIAAWKPADEAQRYFTEAQWAHRWGIYAEATAACEASWALGLESKEVAELRIRSYFLEGLDESSGSMDLDRKLVAFAPAAHLQPGQFIKPESPSFAAGSGLDPRKVAHLRRAMELYADGFRRFIAGDLKPGWGWHDLGVDILENASHTLLHYYYMPELRVEQEENIAALRDLARELTTLIGTHPAFTNDFDRTPRLQGVQFHTTLGLSPDTRFSWAVMKATWGGYWYATPEQAVQNYRELMQGGYFPRVRRLLLQPDFTERTRVDPLNHGARMGGGSLTPEPLSYLAGWTWETRRRATTVWHGFIDELCGSTNPAVRLEGLYLRCAQALTDEAHGQAFAQLLESVQSAPAAVTEGTLMPDIDALLATKPREGFSEAARDSRKQAWGQLKQKLLDAREQTPRFRLTNSGPRTPKVASVTSNPAPGPPANLGGGAGSVGPPRLSPVSPLSPYGGAGPWRGPNPPRGANDGSAAAMYGPAGLARGPANVPGGPGFPRGFVPGGGPGSAQQGTDPASLVLSNVLEVSRFWQLPDSVPGISQPVSLEIANCFFREGRLWADTRYARIGSLAGQETFFNRGVVLSVDLDTFQYEAIVLDAATTTLPNRFAPRTGRMFDVQDGCLYISSENEIRRYVLKEKQWEKLPVPVQGHGRICGIGRRLFLTTDDSILEVVGTEARILASTRRQPAQTILDTLDGLGSPPLLAGPDGSVRAVIKGSIYELASGNQDWTAIPTPPSVRDGTCAVFDDGLLLATAPWSRADRPMLELVGLSKSARAPELLLAQPNASPFSGAPGPLPGQARNSSPAAAPRWPLPKGVYALNHAMCVDGDTLWVLAGPPPARRPVPGPNPEENTPQQAVLFGLEPGQTSALAIGLKLAAPGARAGGFGLASGLILQPTPQGLVVGRPMVPGLWLIPRAELERRREAWRAELRAAHGETPAAQGAARTAETH